jgi:hypothetical protein
MKSQRIHERREENAAVRVDKSRCTGMVEYKG